MIMYPQIEEMKLIACGSRPWAFGVAEAWTLFFDFMTSPSLDLPLAVSSTSLSTIQGIELDETTMPSHQALQLLRTTMYSTAEPAYPCDRNFLR
jgi:hypothetical protein